MNNLEALKTVEGFQRKLRKLKREIEKFQEEANSERLKCILQYHEPTIERLLSLSINSLRDGQNESEEWNKSDDWPDLMDKF